MKKVLSIILMGILLVSFSGCDMVTGLLGGSAIKLKEGQGHVIINDDGELTMIGYREDKDLEDDFDIDFDDDEDDIIDDMQDALDDDDIEAEVTEFKKDDDFGNFTIEFEDFEWVFYDWYETLEDFADQYGDYEAVADDIDFITFDKDEDSLDEDDLEDLEDSFVILLDGGDDGIYYEFESDIAAVDEDLKFEWISSNIIFVEDGEYGYLILDGEVDCDTDFYEELGMDNSNTSYDDDVTYSSTDSTGDFPYNVVELQPNQILYIFESNGGMEIHRYITNANLEYDYYYVTPSMDDGDIISGIEDYYHDNYQGTFDITHFERVGDDFQIIIYCNSAYSYNMSGHPLSESIDLYGGETDFGGYFTLCEAESGNYISDDQLSVYGHHTVYYLFGTGYDSYYIFPDDVSTYSYGVVYDDSQLDGNLLHPDAWAWGAVTTY